MRPCILFVVEDGDRLKQWAIRVDYLLICVTLGVLCSLAAILLPLLQSNVPHSQRWPTPGHEIRSRWTPRSGIDAGRTAVEGSLVRL
jgi:hypothetical protein